MNQGYSREEAEQRYRNTAGEIEARDAANRRSMTAEEREKTSPDLGDENTVFAEDGQGILLSADDPEILHLKEQLKAALEKLNKMSPVADVKTPTTFPQRQSDKVKWAQKELQRFGKYIDRESFGKINLGDRIERGMKYARTDADRAAFVAIPYVLKRGIQIEHHDQHKGRKINTSQDLESWTFAAPVTINGVTGNMAVIVQKTNDLYYKAHKILMPDGTAFLLSEPEAKNKAESGHVQGATENGRLAGPTDSASDNSIPPSAENSNPQNEGGDSSDPGNG